ncbi:MAG: hypothetical protein ACLUUO_16000 [Sellimonas intestinalis]
MAQAGGKNPAGIEDALAKGEEVLERTDCVMSMT